MQGKMIEPLKLEGNESVQALVENVFGNSGFNARRLAEACRLFSHMIDADATVCLTLSGAMTPIGMSGPVVSLIEAGFVDFIISTGANLYHDLHRPFGYPVVQGEANVDDNQLRECNVARIYDTFIGEDDTLTATDSCILKALDNLEPGTPIASSELHNVLGRAVLERAPNPEKSLLAAAARLSVPVYSSAPGDSSIGMNLVLPRIVGYDVLIDPVLDIIETTSIVRDADKNGAVIVGGGSPKNFFMQTQPTLWQILSEDRGGHDFFIQLTTDSPQWGGLSGATPCEARSWGKVKDALKNNVVVYSCASITFPLLCQYVLQKNRRRKHKELYVRRAELLERLSSSVLKNASLKNKIRRAISEEKFFKIFKKWP